MSKPEQPLQPLDNKSEGAGQSKMEMEQEAHEAKLTEFQTEKKDGLIVSLNGMPDVDVDEILQKDDEKIPPTKTA